MSLTVSTDLLQATTRNELQPYRELAKRYRDDRELQLDEARLTNADLQDLIQAAQTVDDRRTARAAESILRARAGDFDKGIPNFKAFKSVLTEYLKNDLIDGWIYVEADDGILYPELVTKIEYDDGLTRHSTRTTPSVTIHTLSTSVTHDRNYSSQRNYGAHHNRHTFSPQDVARRRIGAALTNAGLHKETTTLRAQYDQTMQRHHNQFHNAFTQQFRLNGGVHTFESNARYRERAHLENRRIIHDLEPHHTQAPVAHNDSELLQDHPEAAGLGLIPEHPLARVFDLSTHEYMWVNTLNLTPHEYDHSLKDKLVLPATHRDLLDVLTTNIEAFVTDIIEGKSAGNVILCKGIPGVGKTLTAEVYAELIGRPLYSIHSGSLGTSAETIRQNLAEIFQRAKRWNAVLLLDEADVFVVQRGSNIEQNAIVAEFLRTLEYFDGLLFMTTNRPDDIDEAIISRCAAVIDYHPPTPEHAANIWRVMAKQYQADLSDDLIDQLVRTFPKIAPRDIKMLLRLALRVSKAQNEPLELEVFRRCAMFRAITIAPAA